MSEVGIGTDYELAAKVTAGFESFQSPAYWDVNAWRVGFGSDTRHTLGRFVPVQKGDTTTREDALKDLAHRIPQFERVIIRQVGLPEWIRLPQQARAALLSFAYNYGHLTQTLAAVVEHGAPLAGIARAVEARQHDNRGVNAHRRVAEAAMIRGAGHVA